MIAVDWFRDGRPPDEVEATADWLTVRGESRKARGLKERPRDCVRVRVPAQGAPEVTGQPKAEDVVKLTRILTALEGT